MPSVMSATGGEGIGESMTTHQENIELCKSIFPSWTWIVGIVCGTILVFSTGTFIYATQESRQDSKMINLETRVNQMEAIQQDIDTVKSILRSLKMVDE